MNKNPVLLIIDPGLETPCIEAINCISKIVGELKESPKFLFSHVEYVSPFLNKIKLQNFVQNKNIGAVICLGSIVNVTDKLPYVDDLIVDLETYIFKTSTPFLGICFSHQMFAAMHGFKVDFLKERHSIPRRKHHVFRELQIFHPKLALLATNFQPQDYFSDNKIDLSFKNSIKVTKNWDKDQWAILASERDWVLTAIENRVNQHIECNTSKSIISHARHEQEVWEKGETCMADEVVLAATSDLCAYEALVHSCKPLFTIQTHPETNHESKGGYLLIKNFIYMSSLLYEFY